MHPGHVILLYALSTIALMVAVTAWFAGRSNFKARRQGTSTDGDPGWLEALVLTSGSRGARWAWQGAWALGAATIVVLLGFLYMFFGFPTGFSAPTEPPPDDVKQSADMAAMMSGVGALLGGIAALISALTAFMLARHTIRNATPPVEPPRNDPGPAPTPPAPTPPAPPSPGQDPP